MTAQDEWLAAHMAHAPAMLRDRASQYLAAAAADVDLPSRIADAGDRALGVVLGHTGDRGAALDLLAADGLITLALLAKAEQAPAELERFATALMQR